MAKFILSDMSYKSFDGQKEEQYNNKTYEKYFTKGLPKYWSYAFSRSGNNQKMMVNPTGVPGYCLNIYWGLMADAPKDGYKMAKRAENFEISSVNHQYYQLVLGQKDTLEAKIREGLVKISQSVADLELCEHDLIKYKDFKDKISDSEIEIKKELPEKEKKELELKKMRAKMDLKTIFVDSVDFYAGGGTQGAGRLSMAFMRNNNIMPTIVDDFFRMENAESLKKDATLKDIPAVEQRMLEVKWGAYEDWLKYFKDNVSRRMDSLETLERSRKKSLEEYRDWLKPTIARYKMIVDALESAGGRASMYTQRMRVAGIATAFNNITLWICKDFTPPDTHRAPQELFEKAGVRAIDKWAWEHLYAHPEHGLAMDYAWLTRKWVLAKAKMDALGDPAKIDWLNESRWYYSFLVMDFERLNFKTSATGAETEDAEFTVTNYLVSKNVLAAKYMELKAYEEELEIYIDSVLGIKHTIEGKPIVIYEKTEAGYEIDKKRYGEIQKYIFKVEVMEKKAITAKMLGASTPFPSKTSFGSKKELEKEFSKDLFELIERKKTGRLKEKLNDFFEILGLDNLGLFIAGGPYEHNFSERVKKYYLKPNEARFNYFINFIKSKMNIGG